MRARSGTNSSLSKRMFGKNGDSFQARSLATAPPTKTRPTPPFARRRRKAIDCLLGRPSSVGRRTAIGPRMMRFLSSSELIFSGEPRTALAVVVDFMDEPSFGPCQAKVYATHRIGRASGSHHGAG